MTVDGGGEVVGFDDRVAAGFKAADHLYGLVLVTREMAAGLFHDGRRVPTGAVLIELSVDAGPCLSERIDRVKRRLCHGLPKRDSAPHLMGVV